MNAVWALFLVSLLATSSYAAGRLHGQLSYKIGFRSGYRQGFGDGDRAAWLLGRRESGPAHRRNGPPPTLTSPPAPLAAPPVGQPSGPHAARAGRRGAGSVVGPPADVRSAVPAAAPVSGVAPAGVAPAIAPAAAMAAAASAGVRSSDVGPAPTGSADVEPEGDRSVAPVAAPMNSLTAAAIAARQLVVSLPEHDVPSQPASPAHSAPVPDEDSVPAAIPVDGESDSGHLAGPPVPARPGPGPTDEAYPPGAGLAGPGHQPAGLYPVGLSPAGPPNVRPVRGVVRQGTMYHATYPVAVRGGRHAHPD